MLKTLPTNGRANGPGGKFGVFLYLIKSTNRSDANKNGSRRTKKSRSHIVADVRSFLSFGANQCVSGFCWDQGSLASQYTKASVKDVDGHTFDPLTNSFILMEMQLQSENTPRKAHKENRLKVKNQQFFADVGQEKLKYGSVDMSFVFSRTFFFSLDRASFASM